MLMHHHTRIDKGQPRTQYPALDRPAFTPHDDRPQFQPVVDPAKRTEIIAIALRDYATGDKTLDQIASEIGITRRALRVWMLDEVPEQFRDAQRQGLIAQIVDADQALDDAPNALSLGRARESAKFRRWDAERRLSRLFGPKQEVTMTVTPLFAITVASVVPAAIEGECENLGVSLGVSHDVAK